MHALNQFSRMERLEKIVVRASQYRLLHVDRLGRGREHENWGCYPRTGGLGPCLSARCSLAAALACRSKKEARSKKVDLVFDLTDKLA